MARNFKYFGSDMQKRSERLAREIERNTTRRIGIRGRKLFKENFQNQGFKDGNIKKWDKPKRTKSDSKWYGFEYKGEKRTSYAITKRGKKAKKQRKLNFSKAATVRGTLTGASGLLGDSLYYKTRQTKISWGSNMPYAQIHNEGGKFKVFGKHTATMPQRRYMGQSKNLHKIAGEELDKTMNDVFK